MAASTANEAKLPGGYLVTPRVPQGLAAAVEGLTREVIRHSPEDIYVFAAHHFEKLLVLREQCGGVERLPDRDSNLRALREMSQALKMREIDRGNVRLTGNSVDQVGWSLNQTAKVLKRHRSIFGEAGRRISTDEVFRMASQKENHGLPAKPSAEKTGSHRLRGSTRRKPCDERADDLWKASTSRTERSWSNEDSAERNDTHCSTRSGPRIITQIAGLQSSGTGMLARDIKTELRKNRISSRERRSVRAKPEEPGRAIDRSDAKTGKYGSSRKSSDRQKRIEPEVDVTRSDGRTDSTSSKDRRSGGENGYRKNGGKLESRALSMDRVKDSVVQRFATAKSLEELQSVNYVERVQGIIDETGPIIKGKIDELKSGMIGRSKRSSWFAEARNDRARGSNGSESGECADPKDSSRGPTTDALRSRLTETRCLMENVSSSLARPMRRSRSARSSRRARSGATTREELSDFKSAVSISDPSNCLETSLSKTRNLLEDISSAISRPMRRSYSAKTLRRGEEVTTDDSSDFGPKGDALRTRLDETRNLLAGLSASLAAPGRRVGSARGSRNNVDSEEFSNSDPQSLSKVSLPAVRSVSVRSSSGSASRSDSGNLVLPAISPELPKSAKIKEELVLPVLSPPGTGSSNEDSKIGEATDVLLGELDIRETPEAEVEDVFRDSLNVTPNFDSAPQRPDSLEPEETPEGVEEIEVEDLGAKIRKIRDVEKDIEEIFESKSSNEPEAAEGVEEIFVSKSSNDPEAAEGVEEIFVSKSSNDPEAAEGVEEVEVDDLGAKLREIRDVEKDIEEIFESKSSNEPEAAEGVEEIFVSKSSNDPEAAEGVEEVEVDDLGAKLREIRDVEKDIEEIFESKSSNDPETAEGVEEIFVSKSLNDPEAAEGVEEVEVDDLGAKLRKIRDVEKDIEDIFESKSSNDPETAEGVEEIFVSKSSNDPEAAEGVEEVEVDDLGAKLREIRDVEKDIEEIFESKSSNEPETAEAVGDSNMRRKLQELEEAERRIDRIFDKEVCNEGEDSPRSDGDVDEPVEIGDESDVRGESVGEERLIERALPNVTERSDGNGRAELGVDERKTDRLSAVSPEHLEYTYVLTEGSPYDIPDTVTTVIIPDRTIQTPDSGEVNVWSKSPEGKSSSPAESATGKESVEVGDVVDDVAKDPKTDDSGEPEIEEKTKVINESSKNIDRSNEEGDVQSEDRPEVKSSSLPENGIGKGSVEEVDNAVDELIVVPKTDGSDKSAVEEVENVVDELIEDPKSAASDEPAIAANSVEEPTRTINESSKSVDRSNEEDLSAKIESDVFGEFVKPEIIDLASTDADFMRGMENARHEMKMSHQDLGRIKEEMSEELEGLDDPPVKGSKSVGTTDGGKEVETPEEAAKDREDDVGKEVAVDESRERTESDLSPIASRPELDSVSSNEAKESSVLDEPLELAKCAMSLEEEATSPTRSPESSNEVKETTLTDALSLSLDPMRPYVPELNLDSLQDLTVSSFKMTEDEYENQGKAETGNTNSITDTLTSDENHRMIDSAEFAEEAMMECLASSSDRSKLEETHEELDNGREVVEEPIVKSQVEIEEDVCEKMAAYVTGSKEEEKLASQETKSSEVEGELEVMDDETKMPKVERDVEAPESSRCEDGGKEVVTGGRELSEAQQSSPSKKGDNEVDQGLEISPALEYSETLGTKSTEEDKSKNGVESQSSTETKALEVATVEEVPDGSISEDERKKEADAEHSAEHSAEAAKEDGREDPPVDEIQNEVKSENPEMRNKEEEIREGEIKEEEIREGEIKEGEIKDDEIKDEEIKEEEIKDGEIKDEEIKDEEIKDEEIKEGEIKEGEIKEGEIKEGEIKEGEIKEGEIKEGEIKEGEIKEGEIKEGEIKDEEIKEEGIKDEEIKDEEIKEEVEDAEVGDGNIDAESTNEVNKSGDLEGASKSGEDVSDEILEENFVEEETPLAVSRSASQCTTRRVSSGNLARLREDPSLSWAEEVGPEATDEEDQTSAKVKFSKIGGETIREQGSDEIDQSPGSEEIDASPSSDSSKKVGNDINESSTKDSKEYHIYVPDVDAGDDNSTTDSSTVESAVTKIQARVRGFLTRRRVHRGQHNRSSTLGSIPSIQDSVAVDPEREEVRAETGVSSSTAPEDGGLESAATRIQSNYRRYKARNRLRREDAVQRTTLSMEKSFAESGLQHTGEFHDCVPLPIHDLPLRKTSIHTAEAASELTSGSITSPPETDKTSDCDSKNGAEDPDIKDEIASPKSRDRSDEEREGSSENHHDPLQTQNLEQMFFGQPSKVPIIKFDLSQNLGQIVDLVVLAKEEAALQSGYLNFITSVEDADGVDVSPEVPMDLMGQIDGEGNSNESLKEPLALSVTPMGVVIEEVTSSGADNFMRSEDPEATMASVGSSAAPEVATESLDSPRAPCASSEALSGSDGPEVQDVETESSKAVDNVDSESPEDEVAESDKTEARSSSEGKVEENLAPPTESTMKDFIVSEHFSLDQEKGLLGPESSVDSMECPVAPNEEKVSSGSSGELPEKSAVGQKIGEPFVAKELMSGLKEENPKDEEPSLSNADDSSSILSFSMKVQDFLGLGSEDSMELHGRKPILEVTLSPGDLMKSMSTSQDSQLAGERIESPITMVQMAPGRSESVQQEDLSDNGCEDGETNGKRALGSSSEKSEKT